MTIRDDKSAIVSWVALATGIAVSLAVFLLILFYTVGDPFGTLNDFFNGVAGVLSAMLAWALYSRSYLDSSLQRFMLLAAVLGAILVVIGSILIIFDFKGWVLAGWYTTVGNALFGMWLYAFCNSVRQSKEFPRSLSTFGLVTGLIMAIGVLAMPGIILGIDDIESAPWYVSLGFMGFLGSYLLYPLWTLWLGRTFLSR